MRVTTISNKKTAGAAVLVCLAALMLRADEHFSALKVGPELYTDVKVTSVTVTDIYFSHSRGMGTAKLKMLDPTLQKHFRYDATRAKEVEQKQLVANAEYRKVISYRSRPEPDVHRQLSPSGDIAAPKLFARSIVGERMSDVVFEKWLTPEVNLDGKFVLLEFWATWSVPCREIVPLLNGLQARFRDQLVIIGITDESEQDVLNSPVRVDYTILVDTYQRNLRDLEVSRIPHAVLIDPNGIVRYEGNPGYLDEQGLSALLQKYHN